MSIKHLRNASPTQTLEIVWKQANHTLYTHGVALRGCFIDIYNFDYVTVQSFSFPTSYKLTGLDHVGRQTSAAQKVVRGSLSSLNHRERPRKIFFWNSEVTKRLVMKWQDKPFPCNFIMERLPSILNILTCLNCQRGFPYSMFYFSE